MYRLQNRIDCEENPDHKYCNGDQGKTGIPFCDLDYQELGFIFCRNRNAEPPRVDCDENPNDSLCNGDRGIDGNPFCDIQYQEEGRKHGCYDRNDNPQEYCEKYREIDDDFCEIIEN